MKRWAWKVADVVVPFAVVYAVFAIAPHTWHRTMEIALVSFAVGIRSERWATLRRAADPAIPDAMRERLADEWIASQDDLPEPVAVSRRCWLTPPTFLATPGPVDAVSAAEALHEAAECAREYVAMLDPPLPQEGPPCQP